MCHVNTSNGTKIPTFLERVPLAPYILSTCEIRDHLQTLVGGLMAMKNHSKKFGGNSHQTPQKSAPITFLSWNLGDNFTENNVNSISIGHYLRWLFFKVTLTRVNNFEAPPFCIMFPHLTSVYEWSLMSKIWLKYVWEFNLLGWIFDLVGIFPWPCSFGLSFQLFILKDLMPITFSSPRAQPEVVHFFIPNESPYFSSCKSKISASNSL